MNKELKKKRLLLLGGSHYVIPAIKAAHDLGYYVITCDYLPDNAGHKYADEYHNVSTIDKEGVLELAKSLNIDGILSFANDSGVVTAAYVADVLDGRLEKATHFGADGVINSANTNIVEEAMRITNGNGFDVCVEACGQSVTFLNCIDCAAFAANIILIGNGKKETTFLHSILLKKELNVFGSRNSYAKDFREVIDLIASGKVNVLDMVSAVYPMAEADVAFKALANNDGSLAKVLIEM